MYGNLIDGCDLPTKTILFPKEFECSDPQKSHHKAKANLSDKESSYEKCIPPGVRYEPKLNHINQIRNRIKPEITQKQDSL